MNDVSEVKNVVAMRILGGLLIFFSVVEFGIGGTTYGWLTNAHLGAWWGAICCFIAGVCGVMSNGRTVVITGLVFSIIAIIIAVVGAVLDGLSAATIFGEFGCINPEIEEGWGSDHGIYEAAVCAQDYYFIGDALDPSFESVSKESLGMTDAYYDLSYNGSYYYDHPYYNNSNNNFYYNHPYYYNNNYYYNFHNNIPDYLTNQCVCTDGSRCYGYDLATGSDCGFLLTTFPILLSVSSSILAVLALLSLIYSIYTCVSIRDFCPCHDCTYSIVVTATSPAPVKVQMTDYAQQPYSPVVLMYQPQGQYFPQSQSVVYADVVATEDPKQKVV